MTNWLTRMRDVLAGSPSVDVTRVLLEAQRQRARIELEPLTASGTTAANLTTLIEHVDRDAFVVGQPVVNGHVRPLARFERYRIYFASPHGRLCGETKALGRIKIPTGGHQMLFGYRLQCPESLSVLYRRSEPRLALRGPAVEAELQFGADTSVFGVIEDVGAMGARLRCRNGAEHLVVGRIGAIRATLPPPFGEIDEAMCILSIDPEEDGLMVRISFGRRNDVISEAVLGTPAIRARRRREGDAE